MQYKPFKNDSLSCLGMGNMRLPTQGEGRNAPIDYEKSQEILDYAMAHGINYYDTAHVYNNGQSEATLGKALKRYPRQSFRLATKYNAMAGPDFAGIFEQQLERLQTDYVDFYLMHAVMNQESIHNYLESGAVEYFLEQKEKGRIRNLGFSSHAPVEVLDKFASHHQWDFAQIQLNYLDWTLQDAKGQYECLTSKGIPVVVMEPVRGGRLASLSPAADAMLKAAHPDWSIAAWAFRWLMRLDNVQVILSGMSNMEQIIDNVNTFDNYAPLSDEDAKLLMTACDLFRGEITVPCTACHYCTDDCPMEIDIPAVMSAYNAYKLNPGPMGLRRVMEMETGPKDCIGCGACARHCPQGIQIPDIMAELAAELAKMPPMDGPRRP